MIARPGPLLSRSQKTMLPPKIEEKREGATATCLQEYIRGERGRSDQRPKLGRHKGEHLTEKQKLVLSVPELERMEQLRAENLRMNRSILDLTDAQLEHKMASEVKFEKLGKNKGNVSLKKIIKQRSFTPTALAKPEGGLFNQKEQETLATTSHFISQETLALGDRINRKPNQRFDIKNWPEFRRYRSPLPTAHTLSEQDSSIYSDEEEEVKELNSVVRRPGGGGGGGGYSRRFTRVLTSDIESLGQTQGVLTQKNNTQSGTFKTFIIENWTNTLRKVGVNSKALKRLPNLLQPSQQYKLNLMITQQVKKYKQMIDKKYENMRPRSTNALHSPSSLQDQDIRQIQLNALKKNHFFRMLRKDLPNFIRKAVERIYAQKKENNSSLFSSIYGRGSEGDPDRKEHLRSLLKQNAEEHRRDFVDYVKDALLKKQEKVEVATVKKQKWKRRVVSPIRGLTRQALN